MARFKRSIARSSFLRRQKAAVDLGRGHLAFPFRAARKRRRRD
jgi:hypothetical protein